MKKDLYLILKKNIFFVNIKVIYMFLLIFFILMIEVYLYYHDNFVVANFDSFYCIDAEKKKFRQLKRSQLRDFLKNKQSYDIVEIENLELEKEDKLQNGNVLNFRDALDYDNLVKFQRKSFLCDEEINFYDEFIAELLNRQQQSKKKSSNHLSVDESGKVSINESSQTGSFSFSNYLSGLKMLQQENTNLDIFIKLIESEKNRKIKNHKQFSNTLKIDFKKYMLCFLLCRILKII